VAALLALPASCDLPRDPRETIRRVEGGTLRAAVVAPALTEKEALALTTLAEDLHARLDLAPADLHAAMEAPDHRRMEVVIGAIPSDTPHLEEEASTNPIGRDVPRRGACYRRRDEQGRMADRRGGNPGHRPGTVVGGLAHRGAHALSILWDGFGGVRKAVAELVNGAPRALRKERRRPGRSGSRRGRRPGAGRAARDRGAHHRDAGVARPGRPSRLREGLSWRVSDLS
jgi:hypothetical protein